MPSPTTTWKLIHEARATMADTLAGLAPGQWGETSLCGGWSVHVTAGHILVAAEQTPARFMKGLAASGFRFNTMVERDARVYGALPPAEIIERLRARLTTTNHPPAPVMAMLGEIVVHSEDIRRPLGLQGETNPEAVVACLEMYSQGNFPVGGKKRIAGLRVVGADVGWSHGDGPEVSGPGMSLLLAMTGRPAGLAELEGVGVGVLRSRVAA